MAGHGLTARPKGRQEEAWLNRYAILECRRK